MNLGKDVYLLCLSATNRYQLVDPLETVGNAIVGSGEAHQLFYLSQERQEKKLICIGSKSLAELYSYSRHKTRTILF